MKKIIMMSFVSLDIQLYGGEILPVGSTIPANGFFQNGMPVPVDDGEEFSFVQISDTHIDGKKSADSLMADIAEINALSDKIRFVINTGDLICGGESALCNTDYSMAARTFRFPYCNAIGNHDIDNCDIRKYSDFHGPDFYSFDLGGWHFIILNCMLPERYKEWLESDFAKQPPDKKIIVFQHFEPDKLQLEVFAKHAVKAVFHGHRHASRIFHYGEMLVVSTPPIAFGGLDCAPRGFRIVTLRRDASIVMDSRWSGLQKHLGVTKCDAADGITKFFASAYDTASNPDSVVYSIDDGVPQDMTPAGGWLWECSAVLAKGPHKIMIVAKSKVGKSWSVEKKFTIPENNQKFGFTLKWQTYAGALTKLSAPVFYDGKLYIAMQDDDGNRNGGLVCIDAVTGKHLWCFSAGCSIANAPAVADGVVSFISITGIIYGLEAGTGRILWEKKLENPERQWCYSSPVISNGVLYCGTPYSFAALDLKSGRGIWQKSLCREYMPCPPSPLVDEKAIYLSFSWGNLFALDKQNGNSIWTREVNWGHVAALQDSSNLYYVNYEKGKGGFLYSLKKSDGSLVWRTKLDEYRSALSGDTSDALIILGSLGGRVVAYDKKTGEKTWEFKTSSPLGDFLPYKRKQASSIPRIYGKKVYVTSSDGNLYVLDWVSGKKIKEYSIGIPILAAPLVEDGIVYIAAADGSLFAFKEADQ